MKIRDWFTKRSKPAASPGADTAAETPITAADLAEKVTEAERDLDVALTQVEAARIALGETRTEEALQALRDAKTAASDLEEMVAVMRADHFAAIEQEAAERRADLERRSAELGSQVTATAILAATAHLVDREAELLIELAKVRRQRVRHAGQFRSMYHQHLQLLLQLGAGPDLSNLEVLNGPSHLAASPRPVVERLDETASATIGDPLLRAFLRALRPTLHDYPSHAQP